MILEDANVLLLDEPTRNLSPLSAPVIRALLLDFPGAVLAVTHDRLLMHQWPGRVLRLTEDGLSDVAAKAKSQDGAVGA
jgi:ATPase subunit of ABC transporter with duplicated ATPase domains